jgi:hypothetical protein
MLPLLGTFLELLLWIAFSGVVTFSFFDIFDILKSSSL